MQVRVCRKLYGPASHPGDLHSCTKKGAGAGRQAKHLPPTTFSSTTEPPALTPQQLNRLLAESNAHRIKCFEARERRDRTKALIEDRKVLVLENEARARANQMEMAEIRDRLRFMRELKDLGLPESQIREYMKAQFNVGEPSGSNRATTKKTSTIELGDDDDDEDEEDEEDDGEVVE
ncbi:hypothetical protein H4Q26_011001 [Puccinia striiformis f. sp. tritici PST-130]|nr:hypothetical protein H4Q26_011001 [Puccinia striiformis f. sp. tritici PST-130]